MSIFDKAKRYHASERNNADIILGLPLEMGERKIYPVCLEDSGVDRTSKNNGPRQIGYVEISDGRADYTSLEPDYQWPVVLAGLSTLLLAAAWWIRRVRR